MDTKWMARAHCKGLGTPLFFPVDSDGVDAACEICRVCKVRNVCLEYALVERMDFGVWGGTSERARKHMLRDRRARAVGRRGSRVPSARAS